MKKKAILSKTVLYLAIFVLEIEVITYFVLKNQNLPCENLFFTLPTAINFIIVFAGFYLTKRGTLEDSAANYVPIIQMMLISTVVACVHSIYSVTLSTFVIVLFATVIFNDKKMMQRIAGLAWTGWTAAILFRRFFSIQKESDIYFFSEIFVSAMIIITAYWLCGILIQYQNEKNQIIEDGYEEQIKMQEMLNHDQKTGLYG